MLSQSALRHIKATELTAGGLGWRKAMQAQRRVRQVRSIYVKLPVISLW